MADPKTEDFEEPGPGVVTAGDLVGLRRAEPTIRLAFCRSDGRCPECGGSVTITRAVLPCGCRWHQDCSTITAGNGVAFLGHTLDLLTEALRQRDAAHIEGVRLRKTGEVLAKIRGALGDRQ